MAPASNGILTANPTARTDANRMTGMHIFNALLPIAAAAQS